MIDKIYEKLYKLSLKAYKMGEVPVAALVVRKGKIISSAINKRSYSHNPLDHAEIISIIKASKKLKDWRLSECDMYVTMYPCHMCLEVIKESRINKVYYLVQNKKNINLKTDIIKLDSIYSQKLVELLTNFFKKLR